MFVEKEFQWRFSDIKDWLQSIDKYGLVILARTNENLRECLKLFFVTQKLFMTAL